MTEARLLRLAQEGRLAFGKVCPLPSPEWKQLTYIQQFHWIAFATRALEGRDPWNEYASYSDDVTEARKAFCETVRRGGLGGQTELFT